MNTLLARLSRLTVACLFLPLIALAPATRAPVVKGVALLDWEHMEDLAALNAPQFYGWGEYCGTRLNCTNMVRNWTMPKDCYDRLLVGNEPTNAEPAGHPISARNAAKALIAIAAKCPNTQLIAVNIHVNNSTGVRDKNWLISFYSEYKTLSGKAYGTVAHASGLTDLIGLHCYAFVASRCINRLSAVIGLAGYQGHFWLTEWHVYGDQYGYGNGKEFSAMLAWIGAQARIDRSYIFTNRGSGSLLDVVNANGTLTTQGAQYRDWTP